MLQKTFSNRYVVLDNLGEGRTSKVYLAHDLKDKNNKVAIKVLKNETISHRLDDIIRFQFEAETISKFFHPNIINLYESGEEKDLYYIIMEYFEGKSLNYFIKKNLLYSYDLVIDIIMKICDALSYIHNKNIIHRDLKPGNILISLDKTSRSLKEIKLIDFGLSQIKKLDTNTTGEMVGSLNYISPEQTGVLKKQVDERSDLYSLGIIFYQMLAKRLPFIEADVSSIIHQHIAMKPVSLREKNKNIPIILEKIIFKLLEKEQEDRYQSARGLLNDIKKYQKGLKYFIPGLEDETIKLHYRTKLIGREKEFGILKSGYENMLNKKGGIYLINGEAGIGKTRLAEDFKDYASARGKIIIEGKGFIGENKIPYGPFKEALNGYIKNFLYYTNVEKEAVREKLREYLQKLGQVILKLNPQMEEIIGEYPDLVPLDPDREYQRFITISGQFFLNLSKVENGLIIFLDDMQWLDEGSFELLNAIANDASGYPILIIGTYRDNEVTCEHSLSLFKKNAIKNEYSIIEISIDYFDNKRMNQFISNILFDIEENTKKISDFILQKSRGNPFFTLEILKQMINEKAILCKDNRWQINQEILDKMEVFTNIVDILLKRISLLDEKEFSVLSYASVIGRKFDIELLFELGKNFNLSKNANKEIIEIVERAKELQLLEEDLQVKGRILFVHDRIKEAFYQKIGNTKRRELHNEIGYAIEKINKNNENGIIFDLAYHFTEAKNIEKSIEYTIPAGMKAKENYANDEAIKYLLISKEMIEKKENIGNQDWIKINESIVDSYLVIGKNDEAIIICKNLLKYKKSNLEKAKIFRKISTGYFKKGDFKQCEINIKKGLELLGENLPLKKVYVFLNIIKELIIHIYFSIFNKLYNKYKKKKMNPHKKEKVLLYRILCWMYVLTDNTKFIYNALHTMHFIFFYIGISEELSFSYIAYATICMVIPLKKLSKKYHLKSINISERFTNQWYLAQSFEVFGYYYTWDEANYQKSIENFDKARSIFSKIGDLWEIGMCDNGLGYSYHYQGNYNKSIYYFNDYLKLSKTNRDNYGISTAMAGLCWCYLEMGHYQKAENWIHLSLVISKTDKLSYPNCFGNIYYGLLEIEKNNYKESIKYLEKAKELYENNNFIKEYTVLVYPFLLEAYIEY